MAGDTLAQENNFREPCYVEFAYRTWVNEPISEDTQERKETVTEERNCAFPTVPATTGPGADYPRTEVPPVSGGDTFLDYPETTVVPVSGEGDSLAQDDDFIEPCGSDFALGTWLNEPVSESTQDEKARKAHLECVEEVVPCPPTAYSCAVGFYFSQGYLGNGLATDDCRFLRAPVDQNFSQLGLIHFQNPTQGADKLEVAIRTRHDTGPPSWIVNVQTISPDPVAQTFTGVLTNEFEDIVGAKINGPWTMGNLANLRLQLNENVTLSNLDLSGVEIRLYNASDVLLETIYPNSMASIADGIFREPVLDPAPTGTQWVDRTDQSYWTPSAAFTWNAGGWWDINATGPPGQLSSIGKTWNNDLKPLAMRLTHDAGGAAGDVSGLASAVRYGKRLNYVSGDIVDFAEVDLWSQDMELINWVSQPAGNKLTKIEFLECIWAEKIGTGAGPTAHTNSHWTGALDIYWDGAAWNSYAGGNGLAEVGTWVNDYRPSKIRVDYTDDDTFNLQLFDSAFNVIASDAAYVSGTELDITYVGLDIIRLGLAGSTANLVITSIEFLS